MRARVAKQGFRFFFHTSNQDLSTTLPAAKALRTVQLALPSPDQAYSDNVDPVELLHSLTILFRIVETYLGPVASRDFDSFQALFARNAPAQANQVEGARYNSIDEQVEDMFEGVFEDTAFSFRLQITLTITTHETREQESEGKREDESCNKSTK